MKTLFSLVAVSFLMMSAPAQAFQQFTCWNLPADINSTDRVVISVESATRVGTLFLTSGLDDAGNQNSIGPLTLELTSIQLGMGMWIAKNTTSTFTVMIPESSLGFPSDNVQMALDMMSNSSSHVSTQLGCLTRIYE